MARSLPLIEARRIASTIGRAAHEAVELRGHDRTVAVLHGPAIVRIVDRALHLPQRVLLGRRVRIVECLPQPIGHAVALALISIVDGAVKDRPPLRRCIGGRSGQGPGSFPADVHDRRRTAALDARREFVGREPAGCLRINGAVALERRHHPARRLIVDVADAADRVCDRLGNGARAAHNALDNCRSSPAQRAADAGTHCRARGAVDEPLPLSCPGSAAQGRTGAGADRHAGAEVGSAGARSYWQDNGTADIADRRRNGVLFLGRLVDLALALDRLIVPLFGLGIAGPVFQGAVDQFSETGRIVRICAGTSSGGIERAAVGLLGLISSRARGRIRGRRDVKAVSGPRGLCRGRLIELVEEVRASGLAGLTLGLSVAANAIALGLIRRKLVNRGLAHPAAREPC
jgi:hypothetical protein